MFVLILFGFCTRFLASGKFLAIFFLQISPLPHSLYFLWVLQIILVLNLLTMFEKSLMLFKCQCFSCMFSSVLPFHLQIFSLSIWFLVSWIWGVYWQFIWQLSWIQCFFESLDWHLCHFANPLSLSLKILFLPYCLSLSSGHLVTC